MPPYSKLTAEDSGLPSDSRCALNDTSRIVVLHGKSEKFLMNKCHPKNILPPIRKILYFIGLNRHILTNAI